LDAPLNISGDLNDKDVKDHDGYVYNLISSCGGGNLKKIQAFTGIEPMTLGQLSNLNIVAYIWKFKHSLSVLCYLNDINYLF